MAGDCMIHGRYGICGPGCGQPHNTLNGGFTPQQIESMARERYRRHGLDYERRNVIGPDGHTDLSRMCRDLDRRDRRRGG